MNTLLLILSWLDLLACLWFLVGFYAWLRSSHVPQTRRENFGDCALFTFLGLISALMLTRFETEAPRMSRQEWQEFIEQHPPWV